MTNKTADLRRLSALLDILLPGTHGFPPASATGAIERLAAQVAQAPLISEMLAAAGGDFAERDMPARIGVVSTMEERLGDQFQAFLTAAYNEYYTDPAVLRVIAAEAGYHHPPQPSGYAMPAFDDSILHTVRQAPSSWRREPASHSEGKTP